MDVNLLVVIITSILLLSVIMLLLFCVDLSQVNNFKFFKNEKFHQLTYFVVLGIIMFLINVILFNDGAIEYLRHIIIISILLVIFRRGVVQR